MSMDLKKRELIAKENELWPENEDDNQHTSLFVIIILIVGFVAVFGIGLGLGLNLGSSNSTSTSSSSSSSVFSKLETVYELMMESWYFGDEVEDLSETLIDNAITGMVSSDLDLHTEYYSAEDMSEFTTSLTSENYGIGIRYVNADQKVVTVVYKDSPAEKAGIQVGDILIAVDGTDLSTLEDGVTASDLVVGAQGTTVVITVSRDGEAIDFECERDSFAASVYGYMLEDGVGYLNVSDFADTTAEDAKVYLDDMVNEGATTLIIDLRNDGGGYLTTMRDMASLFIPENTLALYTEDSDGNRSDVYTTGGNYTQFEKYIILTNSNTASASEAFTLAMKQSGLDVTVVGTQSYGKGTVQVTLALSDGSYLKITNQKWFAPDGTNIDLVGITPDIVVENDAVLSLTIVGYSEEYATGYDTVSTLNMFAQYALNYLGYEVDRTDGYFDTSTDDALTQFAADYQLDYDGTISEDIYTTLLNRIYYVNGTDLTKDYQLQAALEVANE